MKDAKATRASRPLALLLGMLAATGLSGCAGGQSATPIDPAAIIADRETTTAQQVSAAESLASDLLSQDAARADREPLKAVAWRRTSPSAVRLVAIEALVEHDSDDSARMLSLMLPTETDWSMIEAVSRLAAERGWTELAPALVRSWARQVVEPPDDERPERAALAALFPETNVLQTVFNIFARPAEDDAGERARAAAWTLTQRIDPDGEATRSFILADSSGSDDPMLDDLRAGARDLGAVPRTAEQIEYLRRLRRPEHHQLWRTVSAVRVGLSDEQSRGIAFRHVAPLAWTATHEPGWLDMTHADHADAIEASLQGRKRHPRTDGVVDFKAARETFSAWRDSLAWADLLLIRIAARAIEDPSVVAALFEQADRDRLDTTTELGGLIDALGSGFTARLFPPRPGQRISDRRFVASPEMIESSAASMYHYHFHAQSARNAEYAGPGAGDIEYADRFGAACLVFTFITGDTLNADYYQPGGARVDLGMIRRPR